MPGEVPCPGIKLHRFTTAENLRHLRRDAQLAYPITALCFVDPFALDVTPSVFPLGLAMRACFTDDSNPRV
jgi:hypothetical protein